MAMGDQLELDLANAQANLKMHEMEIQMRVQEEMAKMAMERQKPFDETEDFRDFVVWLCGFTDQDDPPDAKGWKKLREKAKRMAAEFAARSLEGKKKKFEREYLYNPYVANQYTTDTVTITTNAGDTAAAGTYTLTGAYGK